MITIIVIFYISFSLYCSFKNMNGFYSWDGDYQEPQKPKEAFREGFLVLPVLTLVAGSIVGSIIFVGAVGIGILLGAIWIFENMP